MKRLLPLLLLLLTLLLTACIHRPARVQFSERKCVKGTVEFHTFYCHSVEGKSDLVCDVPVAVCVVVDPQTNALTDVVVLKGQNPFDTDDDEAAASDKTKQKGRKGNDKDND